MKRITASVAPLLSSSARNSPWTPAQDMERLRAFLSRFQITPLRRAPAKPAAQGVPGEHRRTHTGLNKLAFVYLAGTLSSMIRQVKQHLVRRLTVTLAMIGLAACSGSGSNSAPSSAAVPPDIQAIFNKPLYNDAIWGLRVIDLDDGQVLINLNSDQQLYIGSVRKIFSVGELLNQVGPNYTYNTPIYRQGTISNGVLQGDLILVASGDLTMGGRTNPDGSIAVSNYDHNEADSLGNAVLTAPNPLAGYTTLAQAVAATGIKEITGDVVIDDRLFQPFNFRNEFFVRPIFVNDDVVDLTINPTTAGQPASVVSRPVSAALQVDNQLTTGAAGSTSTLKLDPEFPQCIGSPGCGAAITGEIPANLVPPLTNELPLVQTFRIVQPSNYARTVLIEALTAAGVKVDAAPIAVNPTQLLPPQDSYSASDLITQLTGLPYSDDAKLILKVSYNIGADTSLVLYGLTQGVDNMNAALDAEQVNLARNYEIPSNEYHFVDGSGGGNTTAENIAVTQMLSAMTTTQGYTAFFNGLPILGIDGSLAFVTDFESDPTLAGAAGQVRAKTGTYVLGSSTETTLKGQALGGYILTRAGKHLAFQLVVNNVPITSLNDVLQVFQDEGTISAILWRDN
jgi:D-alanyl-D-alanine carboxypeptidase